VMEAGSWSGSLIWMSALVSNVVTEWSPRKCPWWNSIKFVLSLWTSSRMLVSYHSITRHYTLDELKNCNTRKWTDSSWLIKCEHRLAIMVKCKGTKSGGII
jgi:hypothetical protein